MEPYLSKTLEFRIEVSIVRLSTRTWNVLTTVVVIGIIAAAGWFVYDMRTQSSQQPRAVATGGSTPAPTYTLAPEFTPVPKPSSTPPVKIKQSKPTEIYFPSIKVTRRIVSDPCPYDGEHIVPNHDDFTVACTVNNPKLAPVLPGTSTSNATMIVAHTWHARPSWKESVPYAAFNPLFNWDTGTYTLKKGDEVWVKTAESKDHWLVYVITGFSEPTKTLDNDDMWGFTDKPEPNTLKVVGCQQSSELGVLSSHNIRIDATFDHVA